MPSAARGNSPPCSLTLTCPVASDLEYVGADGHLHTPVMVHRALLGSIERFFGVLIEHYAGAFPVWLAPVQAVVLPISDKHLAYAREVHEALRRANVRAGLDDRNEKLNARIRDAQLQKVPFMLVVGDREAQGRGVAVRRRDTGRCRLSSPGRFYRLDSAAYRHQSHEMVSCVLASGYFGTHGHAPRCDQRRRIRE